LPDGSTDLLVDCSTGELHVVGVMAQAFRVPENAGPLFGVRLQPWAAFSWLGVAASELIDANVPLREVAPRLAAALQGAASPGLVLDRLARVERARPMDLRVQQVIRSFGVGSRVAQAARSVGLTERQLGRLFKQHVGMAPKQLFRVLRLQRALTYQAESMAEAAARAGYVDQAHLCRDARELAGASATALRSELEQHV
jgi:AraC-like DNA-binding protein